MAKSKKETRWKLPYWISNNGDGSASIQIVETEEEAERKDDEQNESGDGWAESCCGYIEIIMIDGVPHYHHSDYEWMGDKYVVVEKTAPLIKA